MRYIPPDWVRWVEQHRQQLGGVVYFMDDDLLEWHGTQAMPLRYHYKITTLALFRCRWLKRMGAQLWVSTAFLTEKYTQWSPTLIAPVPLPLLPGTPDEKSPFTVFYHGSASHRREKQWLRPIIRRVLEQVPQIHFEIIGSNPVHRLYRDLPRTEIVHPLSWENYLAFCRNRIRHVGLAPLLESSFNAGRSYIKFFDIERCGAVGIYSNARVFSQFVHHDVDGVLLDNDPDRWVEAILELFYNPSRRHQLAQAAQQRVSELQTSA